MYGETGGRLEASGTCVLWSFVAACQGYIPEASQSQNWHLTYYWPTFYDWRLLVSLEPWIQPCCRAWLSACKKSCVGK